MNRSASTLFACAYCRSDIESDSFFCDQCGKEIMLCETCGLPGRGEWCEEDGGALKAARTANTVTSAPPAQSPVPALKLVNENLRLFIPIQQDAVFGRTQGPYTAQLGAQGAISGKHLVFGYDPVSGWTVQDVGSTHGTKYSRTNTNWHQQPKLTPHVPVALADKAFLLVANVEFTIQLDNAAGATQRI